MFVGLFGTSGFDLMRKTRDTNHEINRRYFPQVQVRYGALGITVFPFFTIFEIQNAWGPMRWYLDRRDDPLKYFCIVTSY